MIHRVIVIGLLKVWIPRGLDEVWHCGVSVGKAMYGVWGELIDGECSGMQPVLLSWCVAPGRDLGASGGPDLCELAGEKGIAVEGVGNLFNAVDNGGVVTVAQEKADPLEGEMRVLSE